MSHPDAVVSKGEFAKICGVSPGAVTQWINADKISGDALVGEGRNAKIRVALAQKQLRLRRDIGQASANGARTRLKLGDPVDHVDENRPSPGPRLPDADEQVDAALKRGRLEALERQNRIEAAEEAKSQGRYTETATVRSEMGRLATQLMRIVEGALPELASAIAAEFKLEPRDVTHHLNEQFRKVREKAAESAAQIAATLPELVEDASSA